MAAAACASPPPTRRCCWLKYVYGISKLAGLRGDIIGPDEITQYHPYLDTTGVKAAFLTVTDGHVSPS